VPLTVTSPPPDGRSPSLSIRSLPRPPVARIASQTSTFRPMSTCEVIAALPGRRPPYAVRPERVDRDPSLTHDGHWKPTDAGRMQSGQIVRSQRWQRMCASRSGCR
jgi:hypothetical protein